MCYFSFFQKKSNEIKISSAPGIVLHHIPGDIVGEIGADVYGFGSVVYLYIPSVFTHQRQHVDF